MGGRVGALMFGRAGWAGSNAAFGRWESAHNVGKRIFRQGCDAGGAWGGPLNLKAKKSASAPRKIKTRLHRLLARRAERTGLSAWAPVISMANEF